MPKEKDEFTWQIEDYKEVLRRIAIEQMGPDLQLYWSQNPHLLPFNLEGSNSSSSYEDDGSPEGDSRSLVDDSDLSSVSTNSPRRDDRLGMEDDDQRSRERYDEKYGQRKDTKNPPRHDDEEFGQRKGPKNPPRHDDEEFGQRKDPNKQPRRDDEENDHGVDPKNRRRDDEEFGQRKGPKKLLRRDEEEYGQRMGTKNPPNWHDGEYGQRKDAKKPQRRDNLFETYDALEAPKMAVGHGRGQSLKFDGVKPKPKPMQKNKSGAKKTSGASGARGQDLDDLKNKIMQALFGAKKAIEMSKAGGQGVGPGAGWNQDQYKRKIKPDEETIQKWINQNWSKEQIALYNNPERLLRKFQQVTKDSVHFKPSQPQFKNQDHGQKDKKTIPEQETIQKWKEDNKCKKYAKFYPNPGPLSPTSQRVTDDFAYSPLSPPQNKGSPSKKNKKSEDTVHFPPSLPHNKVSPNKKPKIDKAKDKENILGLPPTKDLKDMKINSYSKLPSIPKPRPNNDDDA